MFRYLQLPRWADPDLLAAFDSHDTDGDDRIEFAEFSRMVALDPVPVPAPGSREICQTTQYKCKHGPIVRS